MSNLDLVRLAAKEAGYDVDRIAVLRKGQLPLDRKFRLCNINTEEYFSDPNLVVVEWEAPPPPPKPTPPAAVAVPRPPQSEPEPPPARRGFLRRPKE